MMPDYLDVKKGRKFNYDYAQSITLHTVTYQYYLLYIVLTGKDPFDGFVRFYDDESTRLNLAFCIVALTLLFL